MAKNKRLITVRAGRLFYGVCYTQAHPRDPEHVRAAKARCSSAARQRINLRRSWQKLELTLAANFSARDLVVTVTYDDAHLPPSRAEAIKRIRKYIVLLREAWRKKGEELRYIYCTEEKHGDGRLHHHMVLNGTGSDYELIRSLWAGGSDIEIDAVDVWGYEELAKYLTKEAREGGTPNGARTWTPSRNLEKPVRESELVEDWVTLSPPPGAVQLFADSFQNEWGGFAYLKCLLPESAPPPRRTRPRQFHKG